MYVMCLCIAIHASGCVKIRKERYGDTCGDWRMKVYGQRAVVETNRRPTPSSHRNKYKWMLETRCRGESERESMGRRGKENISVRLSHLEEETKT